jgi:ATP-dependent RNA helicase RhlE
LAVCLSERFFARTTVHTLDFSTIVLTDAARGETVGPTEVPIYMTDLATTANSRPTLATIAPSSVSAPARDGAHINGFAALGLREPILRAVIAEGYTTPTPIQCQAIPYVMRGRDLLGCAQTGTGKTAAFALPLLHRLSEPGRERKRGPAVLALVPTRELAVQIAESFAVYGRGLPFRSGVVFGGVSQGAQVASLRRGLDILVATPGRLLDLMSQGCVPLGDVETLVLDEADRMLDMGFIDPIRRILAKLPARRQNLLFSATMPAPIATLADQILRDPAKVSVAPVATTVDSVTQWVLFVRQSDKRALLAEVLRDPAMSRVIVFTRTKSGANRVARDLTSAGIATEAIHGNKSQNARQRALADFREGKVRVLVATDIAARGIDVDGISHVVNFELPNEPESYVHRIGRTARAGARGVALAFCDASERTYLREIERLTRTKISVATDHPYAANGNEVSAPQPRQNFGGGGGRNRFHSRRR